MKNLIWIVLLFAVAVALVLVGGAYGGNAYIATGNTLLRIDLHAFVIGILIIVLVLYFSLRLLSGILNVPNRLQGFGRAWKRKTTSKHLNEAGLAYFEGRYQKAEEEALAVLNDEQAKEKHPFALVLAAYAANQAHQYERREQYLQRLAKLPAKQQLPRHLLQAESALNEGKQDVAQDHIRAASVISPNLTQLVALKLRFAFETGDALGVLEKTDKLEKANALSKTEAAHYRDWAYRHLIASAQDVASLKACCKRLPDDLLHQDFCVLLAEKYCALGLYSQAVSWVSEHYPRNHRVELLDSLARSVPHLDGKAQDKVIDLAENWLKQKPNDAALLYVLGVLAKEHQLWGKAEAYFEASLTVKESIQTRLALAKVYDEMEEPKKAQAQRLLALGDLSEGLQE